MSTHSGTSFGGSTGHSPEQRAIHYAAPWWLPGGNAQTLAGVAQARGWAFALPHFRGCSGEINIAPRAYHSGDFALGLSGSSSVIVLQVNINGVLAIESKRDVPVPGHRRGIGAFVNA